MIKIIAGVVAAGAAVLLASGCTSQTAGHGKAFEATHAVKVVIALTDDDVAMAGCDSSGTAYDDVANGQTVTIKDGHGKVIDSEGMSGGVQVGDSNECDYTAVFPNVPAYLPTYEVTFSHRGNITYKNAELKSNGWEFDLTLGIDAPSSSIS